MRRPSGWLLPLTRGGLSIYRRAVSVPAGHAADTLPIVPVNVTKSMLQTARPSSWLDMLDALEAGSWNPSLGRFRSPYAFRGQSLAAEDLSSGLLRLAAGRSNVAQLELHLLRN